jgi:hypothetical protein
MEAIIEPLPWLTEVALPQLAILPDTNPGKFNKITKFTQLNEHILDDCVAKLQNLASLQLVVWKPRSKTVEDFTILQALPLISDLGILSVNMESLTGALNELGGVSKQSSASVLRRSMQVRGNEYDFDKLRNLSIVRTLKTITFPHFVSNDLCESLKFSLKADISRADPSDMKWTDILDRYRVYI